MTPPRKPWEAAAGDAGKSPSNGANGNAPWWKQPGALASGEQVNEFLGDLGGAVDNDEGAGASEGPNALKGWKPPAAPALSEGVSLS